jgi:hypothetical protein
MFPACALLFAPQIGLANAKHEKHADKRERVTSKSLAIFVGPSVELAAS